LIAKSNIQNTTSLLTITRQHHSHPLPAHTLYTALTKFCSRNHADNTKQYIICPHINHTGVTLDKGLTLKKQLGKVMNEAYRAFWNCRGMFRRIWGPRQKVLHWIYTTIVRPTITYAVTVLWPRIKFKTSRAELSKLQKLACLGITGAMRTAPTAAIQVLLGLLPLHLQLETEARAGIYRLYCK
jgi:hypothetical protein